MEYPLYDLAEDDYESLPENTPMRYHMISGAMAGILEHSIMFPIDSAKMIKKEGITRPMRGIGAMISGAGPAHALYFACYENLKKNISDSRLGSFYFAPAISGIAATVLHDLIMTPADAVKQRLQIFNSPYTNSYDCFKQVIRNEGISALYRSFMAQFAMNAPYQMTHFVVYEAMQDQLNKEREYRPLTHSISGGISGGLAAALTTPLDVCKTVLNTQEHLLISSSNIRSSHELQNKPLRGLFNAIKLIYKERGILGFYRGMTARFLTCVPGASISWSVYEYFKWRLKQKNNDFNGYILFSPSNIVAAHSSDQKKTST